MIQPTAQSIAKPNIQHRNAWFKKLGLAAASLSWAIPFTSPLTQPAQAQATVHNLELIGEATFPGGSLEVDDTEVGGLSGITYDPINNVFFAISDDRSQKAPARFYTLELNLSPSNSQGSFGPEQVDFQSVSLLRRDNGDTYPILSLDPEGIALTNQGSLWISSEGDANLGIAPFVNEFRQGGELLRSLPIPDKLLPDAANQRGIGQNLSLESLTLTHNQRYLITATENALLQDGPEASLTESSPSRILKYDLVDEEWVGEYIYQTDPVVLSPNPPNGYTAAGLVELLALDTEGERFLALERSFSAGAKGTAGDTGLTVRLYEITLTEATDVSTIDSLKATDISNIIPAEKNLLLDLSELGIPLDNLEGLALGPKLPDGKQSLIMISDNNFNEGQFTQILVFGFDRGFKQLQSQKPGFSSR